MFRSRACWAAVAVLLLMPAVAQAQPTMTWDPASAANYTASSGRTINMIVIHKAEGTLAGTESWFKDPASQVSAHYVVDANEILNMVADQNVAWHAGNGSYNLRSIGIENAGYSARNDTTDAHYRRLASLVAYLCGKYGIAIDRQHIIGHSEVPDPNHPGEWGGSSHHTECPGPNFDWTLFMGYVQQAAGGTAPAPAPTPAPSAGPQAVSVTASGLNVRDAAGGNVITQVSQGTAWVLTGNASQGFVEVYFRGGTGWMSEQYTTSYTGPGCQITTNDLNVRDAASMTGNVVGQVQSGQTYAQGAASGSWVTIRFDENARWVFQADTVTVTLD
jgi:uncharacterized protein YgiM (DUF1202 family)